ncbi:tetratricopeptide repeat protein [Micromonospora echinospora]|uniref:tetratricopeptide repeat protein n=1 Tax=Micromonospora echinospora TaxID=1877 RepID=UPI003A841DCA
MFTTPEVQTYLSDRTSGPVDADDIVDAFDNLTRLSLTTTDPEASTVRIHGLLQRVVREATPTDHTAKLAITAADALHAIWPAIERGREHAQALRANTTALHTHAGPLLLNPTHGVHPVLFTAGRSLGDTGQVTAAITYFHTLHESATHHLGPDHPDTLTTRNNLAHWRGEAGTRSGRPPPVRICSLIDCGCSVLTTPTPSPSVATSPTGVVERGSGRGGRRLRGSAR